MPNKGFEPSTGEDPRSGQYVVVNGYVDSEGGGDLEVRLRPCPTCSAAVGESEQDAHDKWHASQGEAEPKSSGKK